VIALWYLNRGTGVVSLVLLTIVVVLGVVTRRGARPGGPSVFVAAAVHRNASLLTVALLVVHVAVAVVDPYAPIRAVDALVPFVSQYRPLWLGLGALAFDLLLALVLTSLLRVRIGRRSWRAVHWLAYLSWPVAVLHGLGTGTDTPTGWALLITAGCVLAVAAAVVVRARMLADRLPGRSAGVIGAAVLAPLALLGWLVLGPLAPGWAARSGTPAPSAAAAAGTATGPIAVVGSTRAAPHGTATWSGQVTQGDAGGGQVEVVLSGPLSGGPGGRLRLSLIGTPAATGGVQLSTGTATLTPAAGGSWTGPVGALDGGQIRATLAGGSPVTRVGLRVVVRVDDTGGAMTGKVVLA
jgi:hypothetical protein